MKEILLVFLKEWVPLLTGFAGALIGSGTTILTLCLKEKWAYKRDMRKLALEMATADYQGQTVVFKDRPNFVTPLPVLVHYYQRLTTAVEDGTVDEKMFKQLAKERHDLSQADIY